MKRGLALISCEGHKNDVKFCTLYIYILTQVKGRHLLRLFNDSSFSCYIMSDNTNNLIDFAHIKLYNQLLKSNPFYL